MKLYRVMRIDPTDDRPLVGTRRNMLGVRPTDPSNTAPNRVFDVDAVNDGDPVLPGTARGLSVSTTTNRLVVGRNEAVWAIEDADLLPYLVPVPDGPPHHVLEPTRPMTLGQYQAAVVATRELWERVS